MISVTLAKVLASKTELGKGRNVQLLLTATFQKNETKKQTSKIFTAIGPWGLFSKLNRSVFGKIIPPVYFIMQK